MDSVCSIDTVITPSVVIAFSTIDVSALVENVMVLVAANDNGVTISVVVVSSGDKSTDDVRVLSIPSERIVDVKEFIVVSVSIDE